VWFFFVFCCCNVSLVSADQLSIPQALTEELAQHPTWLQLLHYDKQSKSSEILSKDFFLSPAGQLDPLAELSATIEAYSMPWPTDEGSHHARCRFPARYFWLSQYLSLPEYALRTPQCTQLTQWSLPERVQSISLFLVSGYLANPASVFGHALLKLNTSSSDDQTGMFDLTINYGALIPADESVGKYIIHGMTGGYQAGFSDRYFYTQDLVYSRTEFRDIWDYELILSDYQRTLLLLHLWEVLGKKFTYYFLDKNCAFRLAELLELVLEEPLLEHAGIWYAPVEIFHRLEDIDSQRKQRNTSGLIQSVRFIPSGQKKLYHQFGLLNSREQEEVFSIIKNDVSSLVQEQQPLVLDTLLAYYNYRLVKEQPSPDAKTLQGKNQALLARLRLPPQATPLAEVPWLDSPAQGNSPLLTGFGLGHQKNQGTYIRVHWAPFSQEALGRNSLEGDELAVLDTVLGIAGAEDAIFLDQFDLFRIRKLKTGIMATEEENPWSWQLRTGIEWVEDAVTHDVFFDYGVGQAWKITSSLTAYAMLDASAHTVQPHGRLRPQVGILAGGSDIRGQLYVGAETINYTGEVQSLFGAEIQLDIADQLALAFRAEDEATTKISLEVKWYW
ncbi:MAG: DUF4105 domain-containing protein, partial [Candidatus Electrothrix sp. AR3]|nr:DUF4105 domain-containing protein [Candidatus Electrothrix sp. AR3]